MRLREFSVRLRRPLGTAGGEIRERRGLLVGVERDGARGVGEAAPLPGWTEPLTACRAALESDDETAYGPAARHGVETARLDADARARGVRVADLLAESLPRPASPAAAVPVNATVGDGDVEETAAAAEAAVAAGFDCVKVKVGARAFEADAARLRAVREAVGDEAALRADANGAWDRETATRAVDLLAALDFEYVEQPLPATDAAGHAALRGRGVGVALDESLRSVGVETAVDGDYADVVVLKPMVLGGPEAAVAAADYARARGVDPVVTTTVDAAVARTAAVHVAAAIPGVRPCGLATGDLLAEDLVDDPVPAEGGRVRLPDGPGLAGDAFDGLV